MFGDGCIFPIVETGAPQLFVIERETQRSNKMQTGAGIRAKAYDISSVRWNFWLEKDQVKH